MTLEIVVLEHEAATYVTALGQALPELRFHAATGEAEALAVCADAEVLVGLAHEITPRLVAAMPRLRWVQALTTGIDHLATVGLPSGTLVTSARGIHGPQMAEMAFLYMIALSRNFRLMLSNQAAARWERWPQRLLLSKTVVLVGVGAISEEIAARCHAFGMHVVGVSAARAVAPGFDEMLPRDRLREAAARADFLIVLVPHSRETHGMIGAEIIAAMRPSAILINLARGRVVDEPALIAALQAERIAGAGLDVFHTEPLPTENPLWQLPNVIVTPRVGGMSDVYAKQVLPLVHHNIAAFAAERSSDMRNIVRP